MWRASPALRAPAKPQAAGARVAAPARKAPAGRKKSLDASLSAKPAGGAGAQPAKADVKGKHVASVQSKTDGKVAARKSSRPSRFLTEEDEKELVKLTGVPRLTPDDIIDLSTVPKEQLAHLKFLNLHNIEPPSPEEMAEVTPQVGKTKKPK